MAASFDPSLFMRLKERDLRKEDICIVEGRLLVERLLASAIPHEAILPEYRFEPIAILCLPELAPEFEAIAADRYPVSAMGEEEMSRLAGFAFHRGVIAAARRPSLPELSQLVIVLPPPAGASPEAPPRSKGLRVVILPNVNDAENIGSIYRSAAAFGFAAVAIGTACADPFSRKALRVSMGAAFGLPTYFVPSPASLRVLKNAGFTVSAAVVDDSAVPLRRWVVSDRMALLFGNEYSGLDDAWLREADEFVTLPMAPGTDSLNVGVAAGIFLYSASGFITK
jgi:tRNA G18 (ribose-2'-O)-methylase SpoU